ncbi:embryonic protein DC-8-like isoform X2 [Lycium barbarum]|uniref:embryonic protein DC-8-like isoform X2 n=1 Tax=Lycium barbarum TaxID=112863 RepID=UPI00293EF01B|nr:embryonic protein DC-8-like isoform X2 [Lycium barbarum]
MASRQAVKEERAEAAAREAANELHDVNKARSVKGSIMHEETPYSQGHEQRSTGVIGSIFQSVKETISGKSHDTTETTRESEAAEKVGEYKDYTEKKTKEMEDSAAEKAKQAKDSTMGKASDVKEKEKETKDSFMGQATELKNKAVEKAEGTKDSTMGKASEYKDNAAEKAKEAKEATMAKASDYKDYGAEKAGECKDSIADKAKQTKDTAVGYKDYTAEKAVEGKDTSFSKISELKDSAADAARRAVGLFTGKKEEAAGEAQKKEEPKCRNYTKKQRRMQGRRCKILSSKKKESRTSLDREPRQIKKQQLLGEVRQKGIYIVLWGI